MSLAAVITQSCARCIQQYALIYPSVSGVAKTLEYTLDKLCSPLENRNVASDVSSKNSLICAKVCSFASSILITMLRIMTDSAIQFQTHSSVEICWPFTLISYWKRLVFDNVSNFQYSNLRWERVFNYLAFIDPKSPNIAFDAP